MSSFATPQPNDPNPDNGTDRSGRTDGSSDPFLEPLVDSAFDKMPLPCSAAVPVSAALTPEMIRDRLGSPHYGACCRTILLLDAIAPEIRLPVLELLMQIKQSGGNSDYVAAIDGALFESSSSRELFERLFLIQRYLSTPVGPGCSIAIGEFTRSSSEAPLRLGYELRHPGHDEVTTIVEDDGSAYGAYAYAAYRSRDETHHVPGSVEQKYIECDVAPPDWARADVPVHSTDSILNCVIELSKAGQSPQQSAFLRARAPTMLGSFELNGLAMAPFYPFQIGDEQFIISVRGPDTPSYHQLCAFAFKGRQIQVHPRSDYENLLSLRGYEHWDLSRRTGSDFAFPSQTAVIEKLNARNVLWRFPDRTVCELDPQGVFDRITALRKYCRTALPLIEALAGQDKLISIYALGGFLWREAPADVDLVLIVDRAGPVISQGFSPLPPLTYRRSKLPIDLRMVGLTSLSAALWGAAAHDGPRLRQEAITLYGQSVLVAGSDIFEGTRLPRANIRGHLAYLEQSAREVEAHHHDRRKAASYRAVASAFQRELAEEQCILPKFKPGLLSRVGSWFNAAR